MSMTFKQKQCLLCYLGYYTTGVDGIWGKNSEQATKDFQRETDGLAEDGVFGKETETAILKAVYEGKFKGQAVPEDSSDSVEIEDGRWDAVKYFTKGEFACKCGGKYCNGYPVEPDWDLIEVAVLIREHFGVPVIITSGIRCKQHNANVGGVANSYHMTGKAMDIYVTGKSANQVLAFVNTLPGIHYAYAIDSSHVHVDIM